MPSTRPRRPLLKRASLWTAAVVLLLVLYVVEYGALHWMEGRSRISSRSPWLRAAFEPIALYIQYGLPGAEMIEQFSEWCYWRGTGADVWWTDFSSL